MGFLNILGYIGVGLAAALILILVSYLWSRPKETYLYEDGSTSKGRGYGNWSLASFFLGVVLCVFTTLLLINLAHFSFFKSIGLGLLASIVIGLIALVVGNAITKKLNSDEAISRMGFISTIIMSVLDGASFAILVSVWGWF